jgi:hypothetical protein
LIRGEPSGIEIEHITHADPHPSDAGFAAALGWVVGDAGLTHDNTLAAPACPLKPPTPSPLTTPPGSRAPAATEIPPRHRALTLVAFVAGTTWPQASVAEPLAQAHEGFGGGAGAAILFALLRARSRRLPRSGTGAPWSRGRRGGCSAGRWGRRWWWCSGFPSGKGRGRGPGRGSGWRGRRGLRFFSGCRTAGCNGWVRARARLRGGTSSAQSRGWRR